MHVWMHLDAFFILSPICKRKEKKISAKMYLKQRSPDLFDQFVSMTERETDII